jgi:hypothetical protein
MGKIDVDYLKSDKLRLFRGPHYDTPHGPLQTYHCTAGDRVDIVKASSDVLALKDALASPDLQKSVSDAINRRLRQLGQVGLPS